MAKLYSTDLPAAIEELIFRIRQGLRNTRDANVAIVQMPKTIHVEGEIIIRKDDLTRLELSSRDGTTTTTTAGTSSETKTESAAISVTDSTETTSGGEAGTDSGTDSGGASGSQGGTEGSTESGTDSGGSSGGQAGGSSDGGGESESYTYESDS